MPRLIEKVVPVAHALLRFAEKGAIGFSLQQRQQTLKRPSDIANHPHLDGITQAEPVRPQIDLDAAGLSRHWITPFELGGDFVQAQLRFPVDSDQVNLDVPFSF
jgi:hypothetical protein